MSLLDYLQQRLTAGQNVGPTEIRNMIDDYASESGETIGGDEVFWLIYEGHMSDYPHVWIG